MREFDGTEPTLKDDPVGRIVRVTFSLAPAGAWGCRIPPAPSPPVPSRAHRRSEVPVPKTRAEVEELLARLDERSADELESQDVDFKEWGRDDRAAVIKAVDWAVCMANGGGGTIVFGIADDLVGRRNAIVGVPRSLDTDRLRRAVCDRTDPKLAPAFDEIEVPEGTGRVLAMHVHPGIAPYTDTSGKGLIRVGKDCLPLTGTMRFGVRDKLARPQDRGRNRGSEWDLAKARVLGVVRSRAAKGEAPLANADVRRITGFDRHRVYRLVQQLVAEGAVRIDGHGRAATYVCCEKPATDGWSEKSTPYG